MRHLCALRKTAMNPCIEQKLLATILDRFGAIDLNDAESEASTEASPPTDATDEPEPGTRDTNEFTVPIPN